MGTLTYTADACWRANYWRDGEGHTLSGYAIAFELPIDNTSKLASPPVWFYIEDTTDWFDIDPWLVKIGWDEDAEWSWNADTRWLEVTAPPAKKNKKVTYKFSVLFQTTFDAHYDVYQGVGRYPSDPASQAEHHWSLWTSNRICF